jgi:hypothetical protein
MSTQRIESHGHPLIECPSCGLPAEIIDRFILDGAPHPVEHVKLMCVMGHWCTPPVDRLGSLRPIRAAADPGPANVIQARQP